MKSRDLFELLSERPIVHPTRIDGVAWRGRKLALAVRGFRWWESPYIEREDEGSMSLIFDNVGAGCLCTDEFYVDNDEALEDFELRLVSEVPWAQACDWSVYCSGPIAQPLVLFGALHDYLLSSDAFLRAEHFLNQAANLSRFAAMAQTRGFLIGQGPRCIRDLICEELDRQSVPHNVVKIVAADQRFLVRLGNSAFLCDSALAEFSG